MEGIGLLVYGAQRKVDMKVYKINPKASVAGILAFFCRQARDGLDGSFEFEVVGFHAVIEVGFVAMTVEAEVQAVVDAFVGHAV